MHLGGDVKVKEIMGKCWYTNGGRGDAVRSKWIRITSCSGLAAMPVQKPQGVPHDWVWSKVETLRKWGKNLGARTNQELGLVQRKCTKRQVACYDWLLPCFLLSSDLIMLLGRNCEGARQRFNVKRGWRFWWLNLPNYYNFYSKYFKIYLLDFFFVSDNLKYGLVVIKDSFWDFLISMTKVVFLY